ncbi:MAG: hypothetical protein ACR2PB_05885 [Desulfocapsaceae bacterium]
MSREYCFNLTVPQNDVDKVEDLLDQAGRNCSTMRVSRKPDRRGCARYYLSFPFSENRQDLSFQKWFADFQEHDWELFGPNPGRWGLI